jgi:hypothetical protein
MKNIYTHLIETYHISLMAVIFISTSLLLSIIFPFWLNFALAGGILIIGASGSTSNYSFTIFIVLTFIAALIVEQVMLSAPLVMFGMVFSIATVFVTYCFPKMLTGVGILVFIMIIGYFFLSFTYLALPTTLIMVMTWFATYVAYLDQQILCKENNCSIWNKK